MLKELSALKASSIENIQENFNAELLLNSETRAQLFAEFENHYPESSVELVGSTIKYNNNEPQTAYMPFQWFFRIHQCREFIEALNEYVPHINLLKEELIDNAILKTLPMIDWEANLDPSVSAQINHFIDENFDVQSDKELFKAFLDGRSWLDEQTKNGVLGLAGRKLSRRPKEYIGSAIASVTRLINDNSGTLPFFIDLYMSSENVRIAISQLSTRGSLEDVECIHSGENIIYYGAPGTGKSHAVNESIS